jgi:hypothetical protein
MPEITLYTHEGPGAGLTSINVCRVKGAARLQVRIEGQTLEYPIKGGAATTTYAAGSPVAGEADLRLRTGEEDIDLARCKGAVALVVSWSYTPTTIYWIEGGLCSKVVPFSRGFAAQAHVEARYCSEYDLPPQIL